MIGLKFVTRRCPTLLQQCARCSSISSSQLPPLAASRNQVTDRLLANSVRDCNKPCLACMSTAAKAGQVPVIETKPVCKKCEVSHDDMVHLIPINVIQLFDVREAKEVEESGMIPTAVNVPLSQLKASLLMDEAQFQATFKCPKPPKDGTNVIFYGFCSVKSSTAIEIAQKLGMKNSRHYPGGWEEWSSYMKL